MLKLNPNFYYTPKTENSCSECIKRNTCKYAEEYQRGLIMINDQSLKFNDKISNPIFTVKLLCKEFIGSDYNQGNNICLTKGEMVLDSTIHCTDLNKEVDNL